MMGDRVSDAGEAQAAKVACNLSAVLINLALDGPHELNGSHIDLT